MLHPLQLCTVGLRADHEYWQVTVTTNRVSFPENHCSVTVVLKNTVHVDQESER